MRFLIDQGVSPTVAVKLREAAHDAIHVSECGRAADSDEALLVFAASEGRVVITRDLDFVTLVAIGSGPRASVIQLRQRSHQPLFDAAFIIACLPAVAEDLVALAVVTISEVGIRVRRVNPT